MTTTEQLPLTTRGGPSAPTTRAQKAATRIWRRDVWCQHCNQPCNFLCVRRALWECDHCHELRCEDVWVDRPTVEWRTQ